MLGDRQAEEPLLAEPRARQAAIQRGAQQRARVADAHALADAVLAAAPAGVHQPAIRIVARDQVRQHAAIHFRAARQERRAEAGAERRLRFGAEALLGAGDQRGVAGQEVIHRLRRRQLRDRRHHAERVAGQHHHVARLAAAQREFDVGDVLDRIGRAGVLGQRLVGQVQPAVRVGDDVLQHGAEAMAGGPDLRFVLGRQVDHLGVAAAFEVEHAVVAPAVLVVADQLAMRIGRQRGLAGAGQAEEQRDVALAADIGAAMHRQHAAFRQDPVHHGEDRFLDLAGILGAGDDDDALLERQRDRWCRCARRRSPDRSGSAARAG